MPHRFCCLRVQIQGCCPHHRSCCLRAAASFASPASSPSDWMPLSAPGSNVRQVSDRKKCGRPTHRPHAHSPLQTGMTSSLNFSIGSLWIFPVLSARIATFTAERSPAHRYVTPLPLVNMVLLGGDCRSEILMLHVKESQVSRIFRISVEQTSGILLQYPA